jgi:carboxymethylenebutenolidase
MSNAVQFGKLSGHLARSEGSGPWPALIVIQEWWGLDDQTRGIADRFAGEGYLAFAPDLYHGEAARPGDSEKARALSQRYGPSAPAELAGAYDALKQHPDVDGRVGAVGFCFGGRMALSLGLQRPLEAVCTFYGGGMQVLFDELHRLRSPVLGLFGEQDVSIPVGTVQEFDRRLDQLGVDHEIRVYPNAGHAFFREGDPKVYRPEAALDAWQRVREFFAKYLRS